MDATWRARATSWLGQPIGRLPTLVLAGVIVAAPAWLMADALRTFFLQGDDFAYLAEARTWPRLLGSLWTPHNAHVVPLFRIWTWILATLAGRLEHLPLVVAVASYGALVLVMLAGGHVVAHEARDLALGLAAMVLLGVTTVMQPATVWYSAGQALWAAVGVLSMLAALQLWRDSGRDLWLIAAGLAAAAAPAFWSGGYAAGPVGAVYLWLGGANRPRARAAAAAMLAAAVLFATLALGMSGRAVLGQAARTGSPSDLVSHLGQGALNACQAMAEALALANLGHDAQTTAGQGLLLTCGLIALWASSVRLSGQVAPLEAAGAALLALSLLMTFAFRGNFTYGSLRSYGWYHVIPQVGLVLLLAGWCIRRGVRPGGPMRLRPVTRGAACLIVILMAALLILHSPRATRLLAHSVGWPGAAPTEVRAAAVLRAREQRAFFARLDHAEALARSLGVGRPAIQRSIGRILGPGVPAEAHDLDAADLLDVPQEQAGGRDVPITPELRELLRPPHPPP